MGTWKFLIGSPISFPDFAGGGSGSGEQAAKRRPAERSVAPTIDAKHHLPRDSVAGRLSMTNRSFRHVTTPNGSVDQLSPPYDGGDGTRSDRGAAGAFGTRVVLTAFVFKRGRGTGIAIAAASGGSSSSGAARK